MNDIVHDSLTKICKFTINKNIIYRIYLHKHKKLSPKLPVIKYSAEKKNT